MLHSTCLVYRSFSLGKPIAPLKVIFQGTHIAVNLCKKEWLVSPWEVWFIGLSPFFLEDFSQVKINAGQNLCPTEVKGIFASNFSKADLAPLDLKAVLLEQEQSKSYVWSSARCPGLTPGNTIFSKPSCRHENLFKTTLKCKLHWRAHHMLMDPLTWKYAQPRNIHDLTFSTRMPWVNSENPI